MYKRDEHIDPKYFNSITDYVKYNYLSSYTPNENTFNSNNVVGYINKVVIPKNNISIWGDNKPAPAMNYYILIDMNIARLHFNEVLGSFRGGGAITNTYDIKIISETSIYFGSNEYSIEQADGYYYVIITSNELWAQFGDSDRGLTELGHQIITIPMGNVVNSFSYASIIAPNPNLAIGIYKYSDFTLEKVSKYIFKVTVGDNTYTNAYSGGTVNTNYTLLNIPRVLQCREDNNLTVYSMYKLPSW